MHFFEFLTVVSVLVLLPWIVLYNIRRIIEAKSSGKAVKKGQGDALRMSELQAMIEIAVEDATAPLVARIRKLENREPAGLLEAASTEMFDEQDFEVYEEELVEASR